MPHRSPAASTSTKALRPPQPSLKSRRGRKPAPDPERHLRDVPLLPARGSRRRTTGCGTRHRPTVASLSRRKTRWAASALSRPTAPRHHRAGAIGRQRGPVCRDCSRPSQDRAAAPHFGAGVPPESHSPTACSFESPPQEAGNAEGPPSHNPARHPARRSASEPARYSATQPAFPRDLECVTPREWWPLFATLAFTGLRIGEAQGLRGGEVRLAERESP